MRIFARWQMSEAVLSGLANGNHLITRVVQ